MIRRRYFGVLFATFVVAFAAGIAFVFVFLEFTAPAMRTVLPDPTDSGPTTMRDVIAYALLAILVGVFGLGIYISASLSCGVCLCLASRWLNNEEFNRSIAVCDEVTLSLAGRIARRITRRAN